MKKLIFISILIFQFLSVTYAQAPKSMKYQAVARDIDGNVLQEQEIEMRFTILWNEIDGVPFYAETQQLETNQFGLFTANIGEGNIEQGDFNEIPWGVGNFYLKIEMNAGSGLEYLGTTQLLSVPYALNAGSVTLEADDGSLYNLIVDDEGNLTTEEIVIDQDGNIYQTVKIGNQVWMAENLRTGIMLDSLEEPTDNDVIEKYYFRNNTQIGDSLGGLYKWNELMNYTQDEGTQGICPDGWHIPTEADWEELIDCFPQDSAGFYLKPEGGTGFNALMTGYFYNGEFIISAGGICDTFCTTIFCSSSKHTITNNPLFYSISMSETNVSINHFTNPNRYGIKVRCIKNNQNNNKTFKNK